MAANTEPLRRFLFFTGKGGVGKTSLACATAVSLADRGRRVLLASTDPASNLSEVLGTPVTRDPVPVADVPHLTAMNIDPEAAAAAWRERTLAPLRPVLDDTAIRQVEEQLSGACTLEVASFSEFTALLSDEGPGSAYEHFVFDTAPTGHTLRLLQLPAAWSNYLETNRGGMTCLGPLSGLTQQREQSRRAAEALGDPQQTTLTLVARPDRSSLREADRTRAEFESLGIPSQQLLINGRFLAGDRDDPLARALAARDADALRDLPPGLQALPRREIPLLADNLIGIPLLRRLAAKLRGDDAEPPGRMPADRPASDAEPLLSDLPPLQPLVDELAARGRGIVMVMGKGGVGKTTVAAALAVGLAEQGQPVHLSTTDPAAHLSSTLTTDVSGLTVSRIDPVAETQAWTDEVMATSGRDLDDDGRALLREELRSPCTEEVAVFHAFWKLVRQAEQQIVILDTAPTGHTLLLLDAAGSYHRELTRHQGTAATSQRTPLEQLQDPDFARVFIVTLPETTPVLEAERLQADLRRAGIEPATWIINQALSATATTDPLLRDRARAERPAIERVRRELAQRTCLIPLLAEPPIGPAALSALISGHSPTAPEKLLI